MAPLERLYMMMLRRGDYMRLSKVAAMLRLVASGLDASAGLTQRMHQSQRRVGNSNSTRPPGALAFW